MSGNTGNSNWSIVVPIVLLIAGAATFTYGWYAEDQLSNSFFVLLGAGLILAALAAFIRYNQ